MNATAVWIILIVAGYLLGSIPMSYLVARAARGIDLRQQGTGQVGGGNLWRMTSRKYGLTVGIYDFLKGMLMVWIASAQGLEAGQQLIVGLAVIVGHNWPVFLRFHGGRGIATLFGIAIILPILNPETVYPWPTVIASAAVILVTIVFRTSPLSVLLGAASLPLTSWLFGSSFSVIMAFLAIFLVVVIKRLTAQPLPEGISISKRRLYMNRFLYDRDIADRGAWLNRRHAGEEGKVP
jgi:glycerol-3-phosphate acyltransferase PlsY